MLNVRQGPGFPWLLNKKLLLSRSVADKPSFWQCKHQFLLHPTHGVCLCVCSQMHISLSYIYLP